MKRFLIVLTLLLTFKSISTLDCNDFKPKKIKLITFDVYAALMSTRKSLEKNVREIIPSTVNDEVASAFMKCWVKHYSGAMYADVSSFADPFEDFMKEGLKNCVAQLKITDVVTKDLENQLINSWTNLIPWEETVSTLNFLSSKGIKLAVLSNGSDYSLKSLLKRSLREVEFSFIYGSTYPKCFKPQKAIYKQVEKSGFKLDEILHIAGADMDIEGARTYGLFAGFNEKASGPYPDESQIKPCFSLKNLSDLKKYFSEKSKDRFLK